MTNYRILKKPSEQPWQYHFHDVAKYEKISQTESVDIHIRSLGQNEEYVCLLLDELL